MQDGATAMVSQKVLNKSAIDVLLWPAKSPDINVIKNVWSVMSRRINGMNPLPRNATELHAECTVNDRTSHRRAHYDQWTALHADLAPLSKLTVDLLIFID